MDDEVIGIILICMGVAFDFLGVLGLVRLPMFITDYRLHKVRNIRFSRYFTGDNCYVWIHQFRI